jgi:CubicO group peptidase (beta-lactamase class C family)
MTRKEFLFSISAFFSFFSRAKSQEVSPVKLESNFEEIRKKYQLPALAGAVVRSAGVSDLTVVGVRKLGTTTAVTKDDLWHLGSNTKMMTAVLAARLVEAGKLKWDSTLGDVFPNISFKKTPEAKAITLTQLLSHRSGFPSDPDWNPSRPQFESNDFGSWPKRFRTRSTRNRGKRSSIQTLGTSWQGQ